MRATSNNRVASINRNILCLLAFTMPDLFEICFFMLFVFVLPTQFVRVHLFLFFFVDWIRLGINYSGLAALIFCVVPRAKTVSVCAF